MIVHKSMIRHQLLSILLLLLAQLLDLSSVVHLMTGSNLGQLVTFFQDLQLFLESFTSSQVSYHHYLKRTSLRIFLNHLIKKKRSCIILPQFQKPQRKWKKNNCSDLIQISLMQLQINITQKKTNYPLQNKRFLCLEITAHVELGEEEQNITELT